VKIYSIILKKRIMKCAKMIKDSEIARNLISLRIGDYGE